VILFYCARQGMGFIVNAEEDYMNRNRFVVAIGLVAAMAVLFGGFLPGWSQTPAQQSRVTGIPDYFNTPNWANSPPMRKFVDTLPPLCGAAGTATNNLGQCIPVAIPQTFPDNSEYYEIEVVEYREQMHSDLPAVVGDKLTATTGGTKLRGYRQTNATPALAIPHYLGPVIVATKGKAVRIKFVNSLPTGSGGDLFVPTDRSVMGAGPFEINFNPETKEYPVPTQTGFFTQNRATLHLHGGRTPWISDGTPHQWITPAGETTAYPKGVSVAYVPDMWYDPATHAEVVECRGQTGSCSVLPTATNNPGPGAQTFYWTNDQSARLMFYHEHAWGITRLGVYVGQAAGYVVTDESETITLGELLPADTIPLIIQDKTYVDGNPASPTYVLNTDPTWIWGSQPGTVSPWDATSAVPVTGDLWWPHVYMPAQNPFNPNLSGINDYGRWHYGPWFWPPTDVVNPPVANPYASGPGCNPAVEFCYPPEMPATPNPSWGAEAFMDTPVINGTAYPTITVDPKAYRLRVLNAAHDRFFNLQLYIAADKATTNPVDPTASNAVANIVWRKTTTGENFVWYMNGVNLTGSASLPALADLNWTMVGSGDFNADNKPDIVWRNTSTGENMVWYMDGTTMTGSAPLPPIPNLDRKIVDVADFNADGKLDIVWKNPLSGRNGVMYLDGVTLIGEAFLPTAATLNLKVGAVGDVNKDGKPDLILRNGVNGNNYVWYMDGVIKTGEALLPALPDLNWIILGTGDLNNDGNLDILWQNATTGENRVWYMDGTGVNALAGGVLPISGPSWRGIISGHPRVILCNGTEGVPQTNCTEVKMVPAVVTPGFPAPWPTDGREGGVPDPATAGPSFIQIMSEGGFLPEPVVLPMQPINWNVDPTTFTAGLVLQQNQGGGTLMLGPAERADVIVDFSAFAGKTLILYNDAPAPWPALDPHYDYYTGAPDNTGMGGSAGTLPGYGPNTRTLMQIKVAAGTPAAPYDLAALQAAFTPPGGGGVFPTWQHDIVVGQTAYNAAYDTTFPATWPYWGYSRITDNTLSFYDAAGTPVDNYPILPKAIQDEQGETFDEYGRMSAKLGLELPFTTALNQTFVLQNYVDPATEIVTNGVPQIWKITHNGVDTHPVHFHMFEVQVLNRVGWDGFIYLPDPNELGWKDTVRISPLEDTIVALRPVAPTALPFTIPDSVRPLNPAFPIGATNLTHPSTLGVQGVNFSDLDPTTAQAVVPPTSNDLTSFGWEFVWHCHILSHEEQDMMRSIIFTPGP
jgi:FtsP/CotA-like multicopper oxidase with cupredoxin domain